MPRPAEEIREDVLDIRETLNAEMERLRELHGAAESTAGSGLGLAALEWAEKEVEAAVSYLDDWLGRAEAD